MLSKTYIQQLCVANEVIAKAYEAFRKLHPLKGIDKIWEQAHFAVNREEAYIVSCGRLYRYIDGKLEA